MPRAAPALVSLAGLAGLAAAPQTGRARGAGPLLCKVDLAEQVEAPRDEEHAAACEAAEAQRIEAEAEQAPALPPLPPLALPPPAAPTLPPPIAPVPRPSPPPPALDPAKGRATDAPLPGRAAAPAAPALGRRAVGAAPPDPALGRCSACGPDVLGVGVKALGANGVGASAAAFGFGLGGGVDPGGGGSRAASAAPMSSRLSSASALAAPTTTRRPLVMQLLLALGWLTGLAGWALWSPRRCTAARRGSARRGALQSCTPRVPVGPRSARVRGSWHFCLFCARHRAPEGRRAPSTIEIQPTDRQSPRTFKQPPPRGRNGGPRLEVRVLIGAKTRRFERGREGEVNS